MSVFIIDITIAYILDLLVGDPYWLPHPVRFIGWLIKSLEKILRRMIGQESADGAGREAKNAAKEPAEGVAAQLREEAAKKERGAGKALAFLTVSITFGMVLLILEAARRIHPVLFHILNTYFIYSALATRCLGDEAKKVYRALQQEGIVEARKRLSWLVGRDTEQLDREQVTRGAVETVAENIVDGIISPLFYIVIGSFFGIGASLGYAYKAVNTLDSMVGYMNEKYLHMGRASAKLDDAANFIPARLTGLLIPFAALLCGKDLKKSFQIMGRDRRNHKSPNCAYPEAAVAGALGVRLGGTNSYFGKDVYKPTIGDRTREIEASDILTTIRISYVTSLLALVILLLVYYAAIWMF